MNRNDNNKPKSPPISVVGRQAAAQAFRLAGQGRVANVPSRSDWAQSRDGRYGLGTGPAGMGPAPQAVREPGGDVITGQLQHPAFKTQERLYRVLPEEGFFNPELDPSAPFEFTLGSFRVPKGQHFWLMDYSFAVLRLSGVDAGDFVYAADGRFSGQLGFDVTITGKRLGDLAYQLDPGAIALERQEFQRPTQAGIFDPDTATPAQFNAAQNESFASTAGPGNSLLPVRDAVQGSREGPFTIVAHQEQEVTLRCVIFRELLTPIAGIEGRMAGFLIDQQISESLIERLAPQ